MSEARHMLDRAALLALRGAGRAEPNPLVGALLVKDGQVIGAGHHRFFGHKHAEVEALHSAARQGHDPRGATMYVTLEPCRHEGKQPPCTRALLKAGVAKVVYARKDPNHEAAGGAQELAAAGVSVELCAESRLAVGVSGPFIKRVTTGLPWVIAKWAQTIDGRVATRSGESKWISSERSRARVHRLRGRVDAIVTGIGTVMADDPLLTVRTPHPARRRPARVVVDSDLSISETAALVKTAREYMTIVACEESLTKATINSGRRAALAAAGVQLLGVPADPSGRGLDLGTLLRLLLEQHGVATVLIEAGPGLLGSLLAQDLIDEALVYIAPMLLSDELARSVAIGTVAESLSSAKRFELWRVKALGGDVEITYRRK